MTKLFYAAVAGFVVAAALALTIVAVDSGMHLHPFLRTWNLLGLLIILVAVGSILPMLSYGVDSESAFASGLVASARLFPINIALLVTITLYIEPFEFARWKVIHRLAMLIGAGLGLAVWFAWARINGHRATAQAQNSVVFAQVSARCESIERAYDFAPNPMTLTNDELDVWTEVRTHLDYVKSECGVTTTPTVASRQQVHLGRPPTGLRWVHGAGYITSWNRLHRAEEALIEVQPESVVYSGAVRDALKLTGSRIFNRHELMARIVRATQSLPFATNSVQSQTQPSKPSGSPQWTRTILRQVRAAINEYRDACWEGLVRQKCRYVPHALAVQVMAITLLGSLLVIGITRHAVLAATVFALVGGTTGLLARLAAGGQREASLEDYGYANAALVRLIYTASMAALAGVIVTGLIITPALTTSLVGGTHDMSTSLDHVFTLKRDPGGIVVAAVFGWLASVLVARSDSPTQTLRRNIIASEPYGGFSD